MRSCEQCALQQRSPASAPLHPWDWPSKPWSRVHIDYAGPSRGNMFLVLMDAHSKWMEVVPVPAANSYHTATALRAIFATHGLPEVLVSDNGSAFTSIEFRTFFERNGIWHLTSAPYHPATNGLAERAVQTFKRGMKKSSSGDLKTQLARFLFHYRTTPHSTTGVAPAQLLLGRVPRTHLDLLKPSTDSRVRAKQELQKSAHDKKAKQRTFDVADTVFVRKAGEASPWIPGIVKSKQGDLTYLIDLDYGLIVRRHIDQIQARTTDQKQGSGEVSTPAPEPDRFDLPIDLNPDLPSEDPGGEQSTTNCTVRRSTRNRPPPDRYGFSSTTNSTLD